MATKPAKIGDIIERVDSAKKAVARGRRGSGPAPDIAEAHKAITKANRAANVREVEQQRAGTAGLPSQPAHGTTLIRADRVSLEAVSWLWGGYLARGKLHVLAGAPGTGKTTAALSMAATVTSGGNWPDGTRAAPGDVLVWSGEDCIADTLTPRLIAAGADLARVFFVTSQTDERGSRSFDPARDMQSLSDTIAAMERPPALLIVDPLVSAVAADSHKNAEVRRALQPLVDFAAVRRCAVLGVSHFTKGTQGQDPTERVTGSLAFGALARLVLITARLPAHEGGGRIMAKAKNNLGSDSGGFRFDMEQTELPGRPDHWSIRVRWGDALSGTALELLGKAEADEEAQSERQDAADWLKVILADGPRPIPDIKQQSAANGFPWRTLQRAAAVLGVTMKRGGFGLPGTWELPDTGREA